MPDLNSLFGGAAAKSIITPGTQDILTGGDIGKQIQAAIGIDPDDVQGSEVFLLAQLIDDSRSIRDAGLEEGVADGHNLVLDALGESTSEGDILAHTVFLNTGPLFPFCALADAKRMQAGVNYRALGSTPLYTKTIAILGTVLAKERQFAAQGVPCRTQTVIVTDGEDYGSVHKVEDARRVIEDMNRRENHTIFALGLDNGHCDFKKIFKAMGIKDEFVLTPKAEKTELRKAFGVVSKASKIASQGAAGFSKVAAGGFGTVGGNP
jgi:hypothetical protein